MTDHPITPPPELVARLQSLWLGAAPASEIFDQAVCLAYQAGADQGLAACAALILQMRPHGGGAWTDEQAAVNDALTAAAVELRTARRPRAEPPSLKKQALEDLNTLLAALNRHGMVPHIYTIRRALEALND